MARAEAGGSLAESADSRRETAAVVAGGVVAR